MRHIIFKDSPEYEVAILIKEAALHKKDLSSYYVEPLKKQGVSSIIAFSLTYEGKKCSVKCAKAYLADLMPELRACGIKHIYVADGNYFKQLTKETKTTPHYGYTLPCALVGYEDMTITIGGNYQACYHNDQMQGTIDLTLKALAGRINGNHVELGEGIIHSSEYITNISSLVLASKLNELHQYPELTLDLETFSLDFWNAGIGTFGFSWDEHNGMVVQCDYSPYIMPTVHKDGNTHYGKQIDNIVYKNELRKFLSLYKGKIIYHNANFDIKILIYELFMKDMSDFRGMIVGLETLGINIHDTKIITYLATNSCGGNVLGLKPNAHEFAGNYAENNIHDIRRIKPQALMQYNLVDCLSTFYVYKKNMPILIQDKQKQVYDDIFITSVKVLLQVELTGMPLCMDTVLQTETELETIRLDFINRLNKLPVIHKFTNLLRQKESDVCHEKWKAKTAPIEHFNYIKFNPASNLQLQELLHEYLDYPVLERTPTKAPKVGRKVLKKLSFTAKTDEHKMMFRALMGLSEVAKILDTFITAFKKRSMKKSDGHWYLFGNFNIGGTVSGRLSSSRPNLQNIPSTGSTYAKNIKKCFKAPKGWLFVGADFASLEDRISALITKDTNKLKVYEDGYDGHCLRAYSYFGDQMPDIINTVDSINSIAVKYEELRQESKNPTFLLTYGGTHHGLVANIGLPLAKAKAIEEKYHELYVESDRWVQNQLIQATDDGFVTVAFGLRVRTPVLAKSILNIDSTPFEAQAESRTAGNALGQSYGLLNNRAGIEFQGRCLNSYHKLDILPVAHIHDAQYFMVRNDVDVMHWFNTNLVECMQWQELPAIQHDVVKLGGDVEIFHPTWATKHVIPNGATKKQIMDICNM